MENTESRLSPHGETVEQIKLAVARQHLELARTSELAAEFVALVRAAMNGANLSTIGTTEQALRELEESGRRKMKERLEILRERRPESA